MVKHIESWDVDPARVVRSLLRPTAKVPTTFWEVVMQSLHDGDALGVWFCLSSGVLKVAAPASAALLLLHAVRCGGRSARLVGRQGGMHASAAGHAGAAIAMPRRKQAARAAPLLQGRGPGRAGGGHVPGRRRGAANGDVQGGQVHWRRGRLSRSARLRL